MLRPKRHTLGDDNGKDLWIDNGSAERVLEAADNDRFVDKRILDATKTTHLRGDHRPTRGGLRADHQHFEVGPTRLTTRDHRGQQILQNIAFVAGFGPIGLIRIGSGENRIREPPDHICGDGCISSRNLFAQLAHETHARIGMKLFDDREIRHACLEGGAAAMARSPMLSSSQRIPPEVGTT